MNVYSAWAIISLGFIALTGFVFYLTGSIWAFTLLLFVPNLSYSPEEKTE